MSDFRKVQFAEVSPTKCLLCGTHEGPFIDTGAETIEGHVYICAARDGSSGCVHQLARLDQMVDLDTHEQALYDLVAMRDEVAELRLKVKELLETKQVSVADIYAYGGASTQGGGGTFTIASEA